MATKVLNLFFKFLKREKTLLLLICILQIAAFTPAFADEETVDPNITAPSEPDTGHKKVRKAGEKSRKSKKSAESRPATPDMRVAREALAALKAQDYQHAEEVSYTAVQSRLPWWKAFIRNAETSGVDVTEHLADTSKNQLLLMWIAGQSKSWIYQNNFDKMSPMARRKMKKEITALYDALVQSDFSSERIEEFNARVVTTEDLLKKKKYAGNFAATTKIMFWPDEFEFQDNGTNVRGDILAQSFCFGGAYEFQSFFANFNFGLCAGVGHSSVSFNDNLGANDGASTTVVALNIGALRKFSESRIGFGLDMTALARQIEITSPVTGKKDSTMETRFAPMGVMRLFFEHFTLDVKGGKILVLPSSIWTVEAGFPF